MHTKNPHVTAHLAAALLLTLSFAGCRSTTPPPDDQALTSAVRTKLTGDTALSAEPIQTSVQSGVVILQGTVSSPAARALAASDASQIPGIHSVVNQLTIQAAATPAKTAALSLPAPQAAPVRKPTAVIPKHQAPPAPVQTSRYTPPPPPQQAAPIECRSSPVDQEPTRETRQPLTPRPAAPPAPSFRNVTVPAGTTLPIRITQSLDSGTAQPGDAFSGSLASDIVVDGLVALPAGTTVSGRVDEVHEAAHFKGSSLLTISLVSLNRRGERTTIATEPYTQEGNGRGKNTATKVGGGAAVGAILGGIFGGGKGAAIGAAAGGGAGAAANGVTRGEQVKIPSETLVRFRLASPVDVRASRPAAEEGDANLEHHSGN